MKVIVFQNGFWMSDTRVLTESLIRRHLGVSEVRFFQLAFDIYTFQSTQYSDCLPQYLMQEAAKVLICSVAFRSWFNSEKATNDGHILTFMEALPPAIYLTPHQYVELQKFYFEERQIYPSNAVIELSVKAWKERIALV
jgi:hypothetical protein